MMKITELPFFHGSCAKKDNDGYPQSLAADIHFEVDLQMFRLRSSSELQRILNSVYNQGSLVDGSISSESGAGYVNVLSNYIAENASNDLESKILEIGFGKGIILKSLKERGFINLAGVEPGNHNAIEGLEGVELIKDFFPTDKIKNKADIIYHFAVWEHIGDPVLFIKSQLAHLSDRGRVIFGVPNCEPYIEDGDISIFLHEHFNYFTRESIHSVVTQAGGTVVDIRVVSGMLVGTIVNGIESGYKMPEQVGKPSNIEDRFWVLAEHQISSLRRFFGQFDTISNVALYAPGRALNAMFYLGFNEVRLVDDNSEIAGKYLPFFDSPVESFEQLCCRPPEAILIFSKTFGENIQRKCLNERRLQNTKIFTLSEIR